ncbi:S24 family peptidase [Campylobacter sp. CX2-4080-23]|uniref:S24 family peptidase n=1 Tax=Campylobacter porcelli TaxID=1660073 RepID=UPI002EB38A3C|nr:S24 family peptidase [Campylobacter sp. CX2-4080-23]
MEYTFNKALFNAEMKKQKISREKLAELLTQKGDSITIDGINWWFRSEKNKPEIEKIKIISEILNVPFNKLALISDDIKNNILGINNIKFVPIVGSASCGVPQLNSYQDIENKAFCKSEIWHNDLYAVIATGDSMTPEIDDGDEVICDPRADILSGDIVHYQIAGEGAIKVYFKDESVGVIEFVPFNQNSEFKTLKFRIDDENIDIRMSKVIAINKSKMNNRLARLKAINR